MQTEHSLLLRVPCLASVCLWSIQDMQCVFVVVVNTDSIKSVFYVLHLFSYKLVPTLYNNKEGGRMQHQVFTSAKKEVMFSAWSICWLVGSIDFKLCRNHTKTTEWITTKLGGRMQHVSGQKTLSFNVDPDPVFQHRHNFPREKLAHLGNWYLCVFMCVYVCRSLITFTESLLSLCSST